MSRKRLWALPMKAFLDFKIPHWIVNSIGFKIRIIRNCLKKPPAKTSPGLLRMLAVGAFCTGICSVLSTESLVKVFDDDDNSLWFYRIFSRLPAPDRKINWNKSIAVAEIQFQWEHQCKSCFSKRSDATMVAWLNTREKIILVIIVLDIYQVPCIML